MNVLIPIENEKNADKVALLDVTSVNVEVFNKTTYVSFIVKDSMCVYKYTKGVISVNELVKNQFIDLTTDWVKVDSIDDERNNYNRNVILLKEFNNITKEIPDIVFLRYLEDYEKPLFTALKCCDVSVINATSDEVCDKLISRLDTAASNYRRSCYYVDSLTDKLINALSSLRAQYMVNSLLVKNIDTYIVRLVLDSEYLALSFFSIDEIKAAVETFFEKVKEETEEI